MNLKARIEAILFLTDKPLAAMAVAKLVNEDVQLVRQAILELIHDYEERNGALEVADDGGYMMQVKDEYSTFANDLAPIDLPVAVVRTLSAIAIKQPVLQSEIVRIRGAGAYDHIKELIEKELISKKEEGRSALLSTTKKFQEYFRLSQDAKALRGQLKQSVSQADEIAAEQNPEDSAEQLTIAQAQVERTEQMEFEAEVPVAATEEQTTAVTSSEVEEKENTVRNENVSEQNDFSPPVVPPSELIV